MKRKIYITAEVDLRLSLGTWTTHTQHSRPVQVRLVGGSPRDKAPNRSKSLLKQSWWTDRPPLTMRWLVRAAADGKIPWHLLCWEVALKDFTLPISLNYLPSPACHSAWQSQIHAHWGNRLVIDKAIHPDTAELDKALVKQHELQLKTHLTHGQMLILFICPLCPLNTLLMCGENALNTIYWVSAV